MSPQQPAAITGLGLVCPAGIGVAAAWDRIVSGRSVAASDPTLAANPVNFSCRVPAFDPTALLGARNARRLDRFVQLAVVAAREAVSDAGLDPATWNGARVGVVIGCTDGGPATVEEQHRILLGRSASEVSPLLLPKQLVNMVSGQISIELAATGPSFTVATACASGATAIGLARDLLTLDRCDVVITGATEAMITPLVMAGFVQMGALSRRNDHPSLASRPFDADRDGFVAGEGAGILVLERPTDAAARGKAPHAMVAGFGASADAYHVTAPEPDGRGFVQAIRSALADAAVSPDEVDHVNAHGTSTPLNDLIEARALYRVTADRPLVTSVKGVLGHCLSASGAIEAVCTALSIKHGLVPPTANLTQLDPDIPVQVVAAPTRHRIDVALSNSFGFGGQNAVLVITSP